MYDGGSHGLTCAMGWIRTGSGLHEKGLGLAQMEWVFSTNFDPGQPVYNFVLVIFIGISMLD